MLIAVPPGFSSDQQKNESTEEACPKEVERISPKNTSGVFGSLRGDTQTCEEHFGRVLTPHSTSEYRTDWIPSEAARELSDSPKTMTPTVLKGDPKCHTKHPTESQGGEFICNMQHAEAMSEHPVTSLQTAVQSQEFCNLPQTTAPLELSNLKARTVQLEEPRSSAQMVLLSGQHTSTALSGHFTNHLQVSTGKSDTLCNFGECETVPSNEAFVSIQSAVVLAEEIHDSSQTSTVLSENLTDFMQTETNLSEDPCSSLQTQTHQSEGLSTHVRTSTAQTERLSDFCYTAPLESVDLYQSQEGDTAQPKEICVLPQSAYVFLEDHRHTEDAVRNQSEVLHESEWMTQDQADCHPRVEADDVPLKHGKSSFLHSPYSHHVKQESTIQSEDIYLSRMCDSHWGDFVTANKVAVEGDFNG